MPEFSEILRDLRTSSLINQAELAEKLGVSRSYISKLEHGATDYPPSEEILLKMADVFGVNRHDFLLYADKVPTEFLYVLKQDNEARQYMKDKAEVWLKKMRKEKRDETDDNSWTTK